MDAARRKEIRDYYTPIDHSNKSLIIELLDALDERDAMAMADATNSDAVRYKDCLKAVAGWDCLNPPDSKLCCDHPWLKRMVDRVLNGGLYNVEDVTRQEDGAVRGPQAETLAAVSSQTQQASDAPAHLKKED